MSREANALEGKMRALCVLLEVRPRYAPSLIRKV
jgi:hypothetical protein